MERALGTVELVSQIMENLYACQDRSSLIACVKVNRTFSQESLRLLWRTLPSLAPFYFCNPKTVNSSRKGKTNHHLSILDPERILKYTPLVRQLNYSLSKEYPAIRYGTWQDPHLVEVFKTTFPGRIFLPNLVEIVAPAETRLFCIPTPLLTQHLRILELNIDAYPGDWLSEFGPTISSHALARDAICTMTELRSLSLRGRAFVHAKALGTLLHAKPHLRELNLWSVPINLSHILLLQSISNLQALSIDTNGIKPRDTSRPRADAFSFQSLKTLTLSGPLSINLWLIQDMGIQASQELSISATVAPFSQSIADALDVIAMASSQNLQSLCIKFYPEYQDANAAIEVLVVPTASLRPLFVLRSLRSLTLQLCCPINLYDEEFSEIIQAFPYLTTLDLGSSPQHLPHEYRPQLSPSCLLRLATLESRLEKISLLISTDWRGLQDRYNDHIHCRSLDPCSRFSTSCISVIGVGVSKPPKLGSNPNRKRAARMLKDMFPALDELQFSDHEIAKPTLTNLSDRKSLSASEWSYINNHLPNTRR